MDKYGTRQNCMKCGDKDAHTTWQRTIVGWDDNEECIYGERLKLTCSTCGWVWYEEPLELTKPEEL